ncbi:hypothetical protein GCM10020220_078850 [Nonomuraea rubra]|uniref:alpha/beta hydrolase n=1 Tax=Nonomuraea rubra TaxID=46180 RepID=UPI0031E9884B
MSEHPLWPTTGEVTLTAFPVAGGGPAPAIVVCPGGAYHHLADHEGAPVARWLNSLGVAAFVLRYRLRAAPPSAPPPGRRQGGALGAAPRGGHRRGSGQVGVLGFSAGGHLAGLLATGTGPMLPECPHDARGRGRPPARAGRAVLPGGPR